MGWGASSLPSAAPSARVRCGLLHAPCSMHRAPCSALHAPRSMHSAPCTVLHSMLGKGEKPRTRSPCRSRHRRCRPAPCPCPSALRRPPDPFTAFQYQGFCTSGAILAIWACRSRGAPACGAGPNGWGDRAAKKKKRRQRVTDRCCGAGQNGAEPSRGTPRGRKHKWRRWAVPMGRKC